MSRPRTKRLLAAICGAAFALALIIQSPDARRPGGIHAAPAAWYTAPDAGDERPDGGLNAI